MITVTRPATSLRFVGPDGRVVVVATSPGVVTLDRGSRGPQGIPGTPADMSLVTAAQAAADAAQATADGAVADAATAQGAADAAQTDATQALSDAATAQADVDAHEAQTDNPHATTAAQVGAPTLAALAAVSAVANAALPATDVSVTNARTPITHASSHATGGTDAIAPSDIGAATTGALATVSGVASGAATAAANAQTSANAANARVIPALTLTVGNALNGATSTSCNHLDAGDGQGIVAALAVASANPSRRYVILLDGGGFNLILASKRLVVPGNATLRGLGATRTTITGISLAGETQQIMSVADGGTIEDLSLVVPTPVAGTIDTPVAAYGAVLLDSNTTFRRVNVTWQGGTQRGYVAIAFLAYLAAPSNIVFEDVCCELTGDETAYPISRDMYGIAVINTSAYVMPAKPIVVRRCRVVVPGATSQMNGVVSIPHSYIDHCEFVRCHQAVFVSNSGGSALTYGPVITNTTVDARGTTIRADGVFVYPSGSGDYVGTVIDGVRWIGDASSAIAGQSVRMTGFGTCAIRRTRIAGVVVDCPTDTSGSLAIHIEGNTWTDLLIDAQLCNAHFISDYTTGSAGLVQLLLRSASATQIAGGFVGVRLLSSRITSPLTIDAGATGTIIGSDTTYASLVDNGTGTINYALNDAAAAVASRRTLGTGATQACAGNDSRLSDTRTPTAGSVVLASLASSLQSAAQGTESTRKIYTSTPAALGSASAGSSTQAAAGDHVHPTTGIVLTSRSIATTSPLTGGGDLSADRTIAMPAATNASAGYATAAQITALEAAVPNTRAVSTTSPLSGGGALSGNLTLALAAASTSPASLGTSPAGTIGYYDDPHVLYGKVTPSYGTMRAYVHTTECRFVGTNQLDGGWCTIANSGSITPLQTAVSGRNYIARISTLASASSSPCIVDCVDSSSNALFIGSGGPVRFRADVRVNQLSTASQRFQLRIGLKNLGAATSQCCFYYSDVDGTKWYYSAVKTGVGNTSTLTASSTVDTGWHVYEVEINAAGSSVTYYIDGVSVGTIATGNIPTGIAMAMHVEVVKTIGTSPVAADVDWAGVRHDLTTAL